jgi:heat shock protein HslJ
MKTFKFSFLTGLLACFLLTACNENADLATETPGVGLETAAWQLTAILACPIPLEIPETLPIPIVIKFSDGRIEGFGGCNSIQAQYKTRGAKLTIDQLLYSESYCEGISDLEHQFLQTLASSRSYKIEGEQLEINCGDIGGLTFRLNWKKRSASQSGGEAEALALSEDASTDQPGSGFRSAGKYLISAPLRRGE